MKIKRAAGVVVGVAALFAVSPLAPASAINNIKGFGVQETLKDFYSLGNFSSEIGYTVKNLRPSRDPVAFPVAGRLYEANVSSTAVVGNVTPQPDNFLARTASGADYRVLPVSTLSGAPLGPGGTTAGKLYFDVVGENPDSVIFNKNSEDLLGWVGFQPIEPDEVVPGSSTGSEASGTGNEASGGGAAGGSSSSGGAAEVPGSTGPNVATPPSVSNGAQNGPYGPAGSTPPIGN